MGGLMSSRALAREHTDLSLSASVEESWWGHPRGLSTLFFTELWERFSYYGMRAILVLFMTNAVMTGGLGMTDASATAIYGLYTAAVYMVALPGGWVADQLLGQRRAVLYGGIVIAAGHFVLAVPSVPTFYLGLILIVTGTGLLKPNVSAMVGDLYPEGGARRDAGFSIYYMGINIGAFIGPLICGYLGENVNWHLGFSAAGIGMVFGILQYVYGGRFLGKAGLLRADAQTPAHQSHVRRSLMLAVGAVAAIGVVLAGLQALAVVQITVLKFAQATGVLIVGLAFGYLTYVIAFGNLTPVEKGRVVAIGVFFIAAAVFWSGFEQAGSSMNLFAERLTERTFGGWEMPASWLQSVNPMFIILLAPLVGSLWVKLGAKNPSMPAKFAYGLMMLGIGFLVVAWGSIYTAGDNKVSASWLIVVYFFHTIGELCISPIGLSSITKLSPKHLVGQMMGIWFMGSALGNLIAGLVAGKIETLPLPQLFGAVFLFSAGAGVIMLIFSRPIRNLIGDVK